MHGDEIGAREQVVEAHAFDARRRKYRLRHIGIVGDDGEAERLGLGASARGMLPKPIRPSTCPASRRNGATAGISQRPPCTSSLENGTLRASASRSAIAWSDTSCMQ